MMIAVHFDVFAQLDILYIWLGVQKHSTHILFFASDSHMFELLLSGFKYFGKYFRPNLPLQMLMVCVFWWNDDLKPHKCHTT